MSTILSRSLIRVLRGIRDSARIGLARVLIYHDGAARSTHLFMPKSIVVYVAGPFRGPNAWAIEQNVRRAEELALEVWKMGAAAICPHTNTRFYQGAAPDDVWLRGDIEIMKRCDAVVLVSGWQASSGTQVEIKEAEKAGIPVFRNRGDLFSWICANSP